MKGYLVFHEIEFGKTHDVGALVELAMDVDPTWEEWLKIGYLLTPYASQYRYPDLTTDVPSKTEYEYAYEKANSLYRYAPSLLPDETHPQKAKPPSSPKSE